METKAIHYLKARNSDFLAGTDLEIFDLEGIPIRNCFVIHDFDDLVLT